MIKIYLTKKEGTEQIDEPKKGCWINMVHPTEKELNEIQERYDIEPDDVFICADVKPVDRLVHSAVIREKGGQFINVIHPMANIAPQSMLIIMRSNTLRT